MLNVMTFLNDTSPALCILISSWYVPIGVDPVGSPRTNGLSVTSAFASIFDTMYRAAHTEPFLSSFSIISLIFLFFISCRQKFPEHRTCRNLSWSYGSSAGICLSFVCRQSCHPVRTVLRTPRWPDILPFQGRCRVLPCSVSCPRLSARIHGSRHQGTAQCLSGIHACRWRGAS